MRSGKIERLLDQVSRINIIVYSWLVAIQCARFGKKSRITPTCRLRGLHQLEIGDGVMIERHCWLQTHGDSEGAKIILGDGVRLGMGSTISAAVKVELKENVLLARNVYISDHSHAYRDISLPIHAQGLENLKPVVIGKNSWLGQNVCILPGVTIGEHCVIGANSVVTKPIPDHSIAVGAPAKIVKRRNPANGSWDRA